MSIQGFIQALHSKGSLRIKLKRRDDFLGFLHEKGCCLTANSRALDASWIVLLQPKVPSHVKIVTFWPRK